MKKRSLLLLLSTLFVSSIVFNGCKKDEEEKEVRKAPTGLTETKVELPSGMTSSSDPNVQMAVGYANMFNGISGMAASLEIPENATKISDFSDLKTNEECYSWTYAGITVYYLYSETTDKYKWTMYYSDPSYNIIKSKIYYIEQSKTETTGKLEYYNYISNGEVIGTWKWDETSTGIDYEYVDAIQSLNASINNDGSGVLQYYLDNSLFYSVNWNSAGHGSYTYGDSSGTF